MKNNKLIRLFYSLKEEELRELRTFVRSPFYNQRKDVIQLFDVLRKMSIVKVTEKKLFEKVFPNEVFDKKKLAYAMHYLMKVMEEYFAVQQLNNNPVLKQQYVAKAALAHSQEGMFHQKIKKAKTLLEKVNLENLNTWHTRFQISMEVYNLRKTKTRDESLDLIEPAQQLDIFTIGSKLRQACYLLSHQNVTQIQYEHELLQHILDFLESHKQKALMEVPVIALYYNSYKTLKEEKEKYFQQLRFLLTKHRHLFTQSELKDFYSIALNFSIKQNNHGNIPYIRISFELYKEALSDEVLFENGYLSPFNYKNIALLGITLKEYEWVEHFSNKYQIYLKPTIRKTSFQYNMAYLHYSKKEYSKALLLLQQIKFDDSLPNLSSRILLLKIYFELDEREVLESYLNSFERMIRRQKDPGYHKPIFLNLVLLMRKIIKLQPSDTKAIRQLEEEISNKKRVPEGRWLLEQLEKMKRK